MCNLLSQFIELFYDCRKGERFYFKTIATFLMHYLSVEGKILWLRINLNCTADSLEKFHASTNISYRYGKQIPLSDSYLLP